MQKLKNGVMLVYLQSSYMTIKANNAASQLFGPNYQLIIYKIIDLMMKFWYKRCDIENEKWLGICI